MTTGFYCGVTHSYLSRLFLCTLEVANQITSTVLACSMQLLLCRASLWYQLSRTFLDEPALMVGVEEDFCQFVSSLVVLEGFSFDGIIVTLG